MLDTCVVLSVLFGEPEGSVDDEEREKRSKREVEELQKEGYLLALPAIVPAELSGTKDDQKKGWPKGAGRLKEFLDYLGRMDQVLILEADTELAVSAAEVAAEAPLQAGDALILASAIAQKADVLLTWDKKLLNKNPKYDIEIREPEVRGQAALFD